MDEAKMSNNWGDQEREREILAPRETLLFGEPIAKDSPLENIYAYFTIEDLESLEEAFSVSGFSCDVFTRLTTQAEWNAQSAALSRLKEQFDAYREEKAQINPNDASKKIALRKKYESEIRAFENTLIYK